MINLDHMDTMFSLSNKVVVVTGACGLLGKTYCDAIASFGGIPIIVDLNRKTAEEFACHISEKYSICSSGFGVDITKESQVEANSKILLRKYGKIDGLINNAANNPKVENISLKNFSRLEYFTTEDWNSDLAVGLTGTFLCCKYYGTLINANSCGGVILNISSDLGIIAPDQRLYHDESLPESQQNVKPVTYSVIKAGMIGLTRYMSTYWPEKVRCNALCPGGVQTNQPTDFLEKIKTRIPMARMAKINEYQGTIIFMLSDASSYMNGAVVSVDGGRTTW